MKVIHSSRVTTIRDIVIDDDGKEYERTFTSNSGDLKSSKDKPYKHVLWKDYAKGRLLGDSESRSLESKWRERVCNDGGEPLPVTGPDGSFFHG